MSRTPPPSQRSIVVISNRGPNDFVWQDGAWVTRTASGGLVSMLTPLAGRSDVVWFCCVSEPPDAQQAREGLYTTAVDQASPGLNIVPVPLPARVYHAYYGQISNEVLWMLQHLVVGTAGYESLTQVHHQAWTDGYLAANRRLAQAIVDSGVSPSAFLVQDYHLYPLPALLRETFPTTPILHFTHIPFPEPSRLRLLPGAWRETILRGLLGASVVGFQTQADVHAFLDDCAELLGLPVDRAMASVTLEDGRQVAVRAYPASVDPEALRELMQSAGLESARARLAHAMAQRTVIRVDRLDPSKNQVIGFQAFERLLDLRPDLRGTVRFLAFLVPSRTDLGVYRAYRDAVYGAIEHANERWGDDSGYQPIEVFYTNDREQALAAMERCDVLLVNSLADGMNLVAKEWAVLSEQPGVLVVSETAGVAAETAGKALLVSPLDVEGTALALAAALDMPHPERARRLAELRQGVLSWTARDWLAAQCRDLDAPDPFAMALGPE